MRQLRRATTARILLTTLGVALMASACGQEQTDDATDRPTCLPAAATPSPSGQVGEVPSEPETSADPDVIVMTGCEVAYSDDDADYYEPLSTDDSPNSEMDPED